MGTLNTYTFDELSAEVQETVIATVSQSSAYNALYEVELDAFLDRVIGEESNELLENKDEYVITDTDILIRSVYEDDNVDLEKLYYYRILDDVSVYGNQTFTVKVNYDTEPIRDIVNTFQEDIKTWANGVLTTVSEREEVFTQNFFSDIAVAKYIRDNNLIFTEDGQEVIIR